MIKRYILAILLAGLLSACVTSAATKSTSTPIMNRDGTITMDAEGNYPREIVIEVEAKAGPTGELEAWMLGTDITRGEDGTLIFHTGSQGSGLKGTDTEAFIAAIMNTQAVMNQLLLRFLSGGLISAPTP